MLERVTTVSDNDIENLMNRIGRQAKAAARTLATASSEAKNRALDALADAILASTEKILAANAEELKAVANTALNPSFIHRLTLKHGTTESREKRVHSL